MKSIRLTGAFLIVCVLFSACTGSKSKEKSTQPEQQKEQSGEWISLFNGKNLDDWRIKFTGSELGENYKNTFRVKDGVLRISYENWDEWNGEFGHIFYKKPFSSYVLRLEYRFVGEQIKGGPGWAIRNNGVMLHCQPPKTMTVDQDFPVSIETQLLGGNGTDPRTTGNVCTPGTNIVMDGELITQHCITSSSQTYHGDQWVTIEIEVHGGKVVRNSINGEVVFEYHKPQLDKEDEKTRNWMKVRDKTGLIVTKGYIALQAETHPTEFRNIEIKVLDK